MKTTLVLAVIGSVALLSTLRAEETSTDIKFAKEAAMGGMLEVKAGQVASDQATSPEVKEFGAMMVTDHTKAGDKLKAICAAKKIEIPSALDAKHQAMVDKLVNTKGPEFDKLYVSEMVTDHQKDLAIFKAAAKDCKDADLKTFASDTVTVIQTHLDKIKAIQASMK